MSKDVYYRNYSSNSFVSQSMDQILWIYPQIWLSPVI